MYHLNIKPPQIKMFLFNICVQLNIVLYSHIVYIVIVYI